MIGFLGPMFEALAIGLKIYDKHLDTKYFNEYQELLLKIQKEMAKPIQSETPMHPCKLRDQNKLDHYHFELKLFLERFLREEETEK